MSFGGADFYEEAKALAIKLEGYGALGDTLHDGREPDGLHQETIHIIAEAMEQAGCSAADPPIVTVDREKLREALTAHRISGCEWPGCDCFEGPGVPNPRPHSPDCPLAESNLK